LPSANCRFTEIGNWHLAIRLLHSPGCPTRGALATHFDIADLPESLTEAGDVPEVRILSCLPKVEQTHHDTEDVFVRFESSTKAIGKYPEGLQASKVVLHRHS
jgi:hypothetical protein